MATPKEAKVVVEKAPKRLPKPPAVRSKSALELKPAAEKAARGGPAPSPDEVARTAYSLWMKRGGNRMVNWIEAEMIHAARAEIRRRLRPS